MSDTMKIEILEDGTIKYTTDQISGPNHASAEELLNETEKLMGTKKVTEKRKGKFAMSHHRAHAHTH